MIKIKVLHQHQYIIAPAKQTDKQSINQNKMTHELEIEERIGREDRGCNGTEGVEENEDERSESKFSDYTPERQRRSIELIKVDFSELLSQLFPNIIINEEILSDCLAKQKPYWTPGERKGYHAWTIAMYQNEICKRVDPLRKPLHIFFKNEIADALEIDFHIGLPKHIPHHRIAQLIPFLPQEAFANKGNTDLGSILKGILNPFSYFYKSLLNPTYALNLNNFNNRKYTEIPNGSAHGFGNARSVAQTYNEFALGGKNLNIKKETLALLEAAPIHPKHGKKDLVLNVDIPFSLGFAKPSEFQNFGVNYRSYGSFGAGGSGGFADPEKQVAFGYVMNKMGTHIANDPREFALRNAVYECIFNIEQQQNISKELVY